MDIWMLASCGHHGMPPNTSKERSLLAFAKEDIAAAKTYLITLRAFFSFNAWTAAWKERTWRNKLKQQSWQLAGIITLADWLGSNTTYFPYQSQPMPLAEYWPLALSRAQASVSALPLVSPVSPYSGCQTLFPGIHKLTPLQHCTESLDITPAGPQLAILEDVTGAGKTEAALILAHRLMSQGKGDGLYVGLPTMATANAMFERLAKAYHALYRHGSRPSLVLAHGGSQMSEAFRQAVWQGSNAGQCQYGADEQGASAECNIWFTDSRKKALLAEVGIGTLDQLLMAVMPFRHQSLRLLGIRNKILILDEVHAYDGYMLRLLEGLLLFHAAQGGSAIILSATLNTTLRTKLLAAFAAGADFPIPLPNFQAQYPWLSHLTASSLYETQLATREEVTRRVAIAWLNDICSGIDRIHQIVARGECVCWIRNTVDEATAVYRQLIDAGKIPANDILLFHSRFAFIDRMAIENQVLTLFGKNSDPTQRRGKVLISTQVIEQSLDVDIDNMLSDLAPIDLLIQRAGRLQRHIRTATGELKSSLPDERPAPILHVLAPEWQEDPDSEWPGGPLSGTRFVYRDHACLWRTQKILRELGGICMPEAARTLVESVYEDLITAPANLQRVENDITGEILSQRSLAKQNLLQRDIGYTRNASDYMWEGTRELATRLSELTVDVYLAWRDADGRLQPYADVTDFSWEQSRLQIRQSWWRDNHGHLMLPDDGELARFCQQIHRPEAQLVLVPKDAEADYYNKRFGLMADET